MKIQVELSDLGYQVGARIGSRVFIIPLPFSLKNLETKLKDRLAGIARAKTHYRLEKDWIKAGFRNKINWYQRLKRTVALYFSVLLLFGCAGTKQPIMFERPKISVVYPSYQAAPWQSLADVDVLPILVYLQFRGAYSYRVAYLTPFGKIPFLQKEIPSGRTNDFWPSVLTDFKYEGDPSRLVFVAKDTVYATPCYVKVQAWDGEKWSEWSELVKVE